MRAAEKKSTEECPVKMKLVAPPLYVLTTNVSTCALSPQLLDFAAANTSVMHHTLHPRKLQHLIAKSCKAADSKLSLYSCTGPS